MANVPYGEGVPEVSPREDVPDDLQRIQANPNEFGGLIAQGAEKAGQGLEQAGENAFNIEQFRGKINVDDQVNHWITTSNKILYGDPDKTSLGPDGKPVPDTGFYGLQGRAAADQRDPTLKALEDAREEGRKNLKNPLEQSEYDTQTRRMYADHDQRVGLHTDQQWKSWAGETNEKGAGLALNSFLRNLNDPTQMSHNASDYINFKVQAAQIKFGDSDEIKQQAIDGAKRDLLKAQVQAVSVNDPAGAQRILEKNKDIAGTEYEPLADHIRARAEQATGVAAAQQATTQAVQQQRATPRRFTPQVEGAISKASQETGVPESTLRLFTGIESSGNPNAATGSYRGLLQLSGDEFNRYGGGDITAPQDNMLAGARKLADESRRFEATYGHPPSDTELYLQHQQGVAGAAAHMANPDAPAWQNMASTGEGQQKGAGWAKQAIWGNIPNADKAQFPGGVDTVTSRDFMRIWNDQVVRRGGVGGVQTAGITGGPVQSVAFRTDQPQQTGIMPHAPMPASDPYALHATALQNIITNPDLNENERWHATQTLNRDFAVAQVAAEADTKAKKDASDTAMNEYVTGMIGGGTATPQMVQSIANDQRLLPETKQSLYKFATQDFGFEANAQFGSQYADVYKRIFLPPGDPQKINDANDVLKLGAPGGGLTPRGADRLMKVFTESRKNPDQVAVNSTKSSLVQYAKSKLSFDQEMLFPGVKPLSDPKGVQIFNAQFVPKFEAAYDAWTKDGKNPWEFLTQENVDKIMTGMRPKAQMAMDRVTAEGDVTGEKEQAQSYPPPPQGVDATAWQGVMAARPVMQSGQPLPPQNWNRALQILQSNPTPEGIRVFNEHWKDADGAEILKKLGGAQPAAAPVAAPPPAQKPPERLSLAEEAEQDRNEAEQDRNEAERLAGEAAARNAALREAAAKRQSGLLQ